MFFIILSLNILVDPDTAKTVLLATIYKHNNQKIGRMITGYNKVLLTFITNKSLNGTGFKAEAKLSKSNYISKIYDQCEKQYFLMCSSSFRMWRTIERSNRSYRFIK